MLREEKEDLECPSGWSQGGSCGLARHRWSREAVGGWKAGA